MAKKHKKFALQPAVIPSSDINITPLVDVVLVLLIIFMVVTPLLEKDIGVTVPSTEKVEQVEEVPPDQLVVRVAANGDFSVNDTPTTREAYVETVGKIVKKKPPNQRILFVIADDGVEYKHVVAALDGARTAGCETLGLMTDDPNKDQPGAQPAPAPAPPPAPPSP